MMKRISFVLALAVLYLGVSLALQPKLRQVLRAPATSNQGEEKKEDLSYPCEKGKTAFDLLLKKTSGQVEVKEYSFGKLVESINGLKGGLEGKYWIFFVEGKSATVGADSYHCQDEEKIEWQFVKPE